VVLSQGQEIDVSHLPADIRGGDGDGQHGNTKVRRLTESMKDFERQCLILALNETNGVKFKAARLLGISRKTLWEKLKTHQITESNVDEEDDSSNHIERDVSFS
jgi:DNA-binding NtrC family response regulator